MLTCVTGVTANGHTAPYSHTVTPRLATYLLAKNLGNCANKPLYKLTPHHQPSDGAARVMRTASDKYKPSTTAEAKDIYQVIQDVSTAPGRDMLPAAPNLSEHYNVQC